MFVGIDVSKNSLDVALLGAGAKPRHKGTKAQGHKVFANTAHRDRLQQRRMEPVLAKRGAPHGSGLGKQRWPVERKQRWPVERLVSWLHQPHRLRIREERNHSIHQAFLTSRRCNDLLYPPLTLLFRRS